MDYALRKRSVRATSLKAGGYKKLVIPGFQGEMSYLTYSTKVDFCVFRQRTELPALEDMEVHYPSFGMNRVSTEYMDSFSQYGNTSLGLNRNN